MLRSFAVVCLVFAGVLMLAGVGWALLAGAGLVLVFWPSGADDRLRVACGVGLSWARRAAGGAVAAPRRGIAAAGMGVAVVAVATGFGLALGVGAGLIAAGGGSGLVALLTGWNA